MSLHRPLFTSTLLCLLTLHGASAAGADASVRIEISGLRNARGDVGCLLFSSAEGYPELHARAYREKHTAIETDRASCEFKEVAPGTYAAVVFHDENLNGKMDKNFVGMPQEGYGASNNVRHRLSAPGFQEASFAVGVGAVTPLSIQLGY